MRIFLAEDEQDLNAIIVQKLTEDGYSVDHCFDGRTAIDILSCTEYDAVILDIMLPKRDGLSVLKLLRESKIPVPVILLTAKSQTEDKVQGLDFGADDYLEKPFQMEELLARLRALTRRKGELIFDGIMKFGDISLNPHLLLLSCRDNKINLTLKESQALELLITNKNTAVSKETIIEKLWGYDSEAEDNHAEIHISLLRKKLKQAGSMLVIKAIRGIGYIIKYPEEDSAC